VEVLLPLGLFYATWLACRFYQADNDRIISYYEDERLEYNRPSKGAPWHDSYIDHSIGGMSIGVMGSCKYILDEPDGQAITNGYHEIWKSCGVLMGSLGTQHETVKIDDK